MIQMVLWIASKLIKWFINRWYKHCPTCFCGYNMKPISNGYEYSWKCVWVKRCGWETYQSGNGKLHWWKKS